MLKPVGNGITTIKQIEMKKKVVFFISVRNILKLKRLILAKLK